MTCFKLPLSLINRIQSALTRFWWDANPDERKMCWVAFSELAKSKGDGGLGLQDIEIFNVALLAKQSWRIATNSDCLLARVLLGKYCRHQPFFKVPASTSISHGWRSILCGRDLLLENTGIAIGSGRDTSLWNEPWLSSTSPTRLMGPATSHSKDWKVSEIIDSTTGDWNRALIEQTIPDFAPDILNIKPSKLGTRDALVWLPTKDGVFTTKSGYYSGLAMRTSKQPPLSQQHPCNWNTDIWRGNFSPKLRVFLWKIVKGALPLGENLEKRGLRSNTNCIHCGLRETATHLFLHCSYAKSVWESVPLINPEAIFSAPHFEKALKDSKSLINLPPSGVAIPLFPWICWTIWLSRNQLIFENRKFTAKEACLKAIKLAREWQEAQVQELGPSSETSNSHGIPPPPTLQRKDGLCVYTDAAWKEGSNKAGLGWIFTDPTGNNQMSGSKLELFVSSPLMAEGLAIREALFQARSRNISTLIVRSDAQTLVRAINDRKPLKELFGIISDILSLSLEFSVISFVFIPRSNNNAADALAKGALLMSSLVEM